MQWRGQAGEERGEEVEGGSVEGQCKVCGVVRLPPDMIL